VTIGKRIKDKRKNMGLTLKILSQRCGLSISYLSDIEQERRKPSLDRLSDIAEGLQTTVSYLLGEVQSDRIISLQNNDEEIRIYHTEERSQEFREVLQKIDNFENWSHQDKQELLTYLTVKEKIRKASKP
jgi:transcriptional regulator with XRE-family HTH domain